MLSKKMKFVYVAFLLLLNVNLYAQSAETGSPFNQYMSADAGVNLLSGTVNISKSIASLSAGDVQAGFSMSYSGNVTQYVNNRNDVAPTGWLGLGWAMGFAKIVCDHNGSMSLKDDSYYLLTAEGNKHKLVKDKNGKWWISSLPYWKVKPTIRSNVYYGNHHYEFIVGWTITDDSGRKYTYGDFESVNDIQNEKFARQATQYVLCWPKTYGMVGEAMGGTPYLYPNVWNLKKMEDLKGNSLTYTYVQKTESLLTNGKKSSAKYTKECYLESVQSSEGDRVEFLLKKKGEGAFADEFLDMKGSSEGDENDADEFVDPIERYYLDMVKIYKVIGSEKKLVRQVEFCYEPLFFAPNNTFETVVVKVQKDSRYVKRLLKSIIFTDNQGKVVDKETYEYNTNDNTSGAKLNVPFGMMTAVQGFNCGRLEFNYKYVRTSPAGGVELHKQSIPMTKVSSIGYLEDGTPYIAGIGSNNHVAVYTRSFGRWVLSRTFTKDNMEKDDDCSFIIGDKGWFIYVKPNSKGATYTPVVWNGKEFVEQTPIVDNSVRVNIAVGAGFIFWAKIENDQINLAIPWTIWGETYGQDKFDGNGFAAEDGAMDRSAIKVFASANHVGIFYLGTDYGNNGRVKIFTFNHNKSKLMQTYYDRDLDDDNTYALNGNMLFGATEDRGLTGHNADVFQWNETPLSESYWRQSHWDLHGVQSEPSIQAYGPDFFVVKHNDGDDMSVFYWNGKKWSTPYKNKNMVSGDNYDFFYESEWNGYSGNGFFIAREPLIEPKYIRIPYWVPKRWGFRKRHKKIQVWSSTYRGALLDQYDIRDGKWSNTGAQNLSGSKSKTHVMVGTDWYIEKTAKKAMTWDGVKWKIEKLDIDYGDDYKSIGGNSFVVEKGSNSIIYFKKSDSFTEDYGFYVVSGKVIKDPVLDKEVLYEYQYNNDPTGQYNVTFLNTSSDITFDFVNNTPIITKYTVVLPNKLGYQEKVLCDINTLNMVDLTQGGKQLVNLGLGAGQICKEVTKNANGIVTNVKTTDYERFDGESLGWPSAIYQDRPIKEVTESNMSRKEVLYAYSKVNGQISSVKTFIDNKKDPEKEKQIVYAAEKYKDMQDSNRLVEEFETRECLGACGDNGKNVVSANVSRYKDIGNNKKKYYVVDDVWSYKKLDKNAQYSFDIKNPPVNDSYWKRNSKYEIYENYKAVQSVDNLGIKSSAFYEDQITGQLLGSVIKAGYNESFLLTGAAVDLANKDKVHDQNFRNNSYNIVPLACGNAVDWYNRGKVTPSESCKNAGKDNAVNYGRFSSNAILVNSGKTLRGYVTPEKKKKYLFSAWVQGVNVNGKARLYVDNNYSKPAKEWNLLGSGQWQPIEWEGELSAKQQVFELKTDNGNNMRVQNVLFIPSEATASITYWDKYWDKPVVKVNDRGIGTFSVLDNAGRVLETYGEDNDGNLFKLSVNEYHGSDCRENPVGKGTLTQLRINGDNVSGIMNGSVLQYVVPNSTNQLVVDWKTEQKDDPVKYAFVKANETVSQWNTSCCNVLEEAFLSLKGADNWTLYIDVDPYDDNKYYTINIVKSTSGWVDHGAPLSIGDLPKYASSSKIDEAYYLNEEGVVKANFGVNSWTENEQHLDIQEDLLKVGSGGSSSYVLTLPYYETESWTEKNHSTNTLDRKYNNVTARAYLTGGTFSSYGNIGSAGDKMELYRMTVDNNGTPYVLFLRTINSGTKTWVDGVDEDGNPKQIAVKTGSSDGHLYVKKYNKTTSSWEMVGNTLRIDNDAQKIVVDPDIVSDYDALDADIIIGNDGYPYVAYIGRVGEMKYLDENLTETLVDDKEQETTVTGTNTIIPRVVVVKRLYPARSVDNSVDKAIWAGPSKVQDNVNSSTMLPELLGDLVEVPMVDDNNVVENMPITTAKRVKLAKGQKGLYLAVLYQLTPGAGNDDVVDVSKSKYALSIFKATQKTETIVDDDGTSLRKDALKFESLLDYSVNASVYSSLLEEERRIVAYLDETDPFDLEIYTEGNNEYPYVMFANEANANKLSVIKYNGVRWLSIGRPAFADVRDERESADLSIKADGVPYVVFKEGHSSINMDRRNMVVPQKYSANGDKDLTLLSLGDVTGTSVSTNFRQYILNYAAIVPPEKSSITITPTLAKSSDVCAVVVENNENTVSYWRSGASACDGADLLPSLTVRSTGAISDMNIPLLPETNQIKVKVYASNGDFLSYNITIYRESVPEDDTDIFAGDGSLEKYDEKELPSNDGCKTKEITYLSFGSTQQRSVCLQFNAFWTMEYNNNVYYTASCIGIDFPSNCSESGYKVFRLADSKCSTKIIKIIDASCKQNEKNEYWARSSSSSVNSSSSVPPYMSSSSVPPYMSSSSVPPYMSSSSVPPYMSSSSEEKCIPFVNGVGHYGDNCFDSGLKNMEKDKCYTMNPDRAYENPTWINDDASQTWWWIETPCHEEVVSSSSVPPYESSSSEPPYMSSSSEEKCIPFVNGVGHYGDNCFDSGLKNMEKDKCYTMNPDRAYENPTWINDDASQTWWWIETPCHEEVVSSSSVPPYVSSSSEPPYYSSSSNTNIPEEYSSLTGFKVFASGNMNISDRVVLDGGSFACASANVGSNANVSISLYVSGNVQLRNNSYTERVVAGGYVDVQAGAQYGALLNEAVVSPNLAVHDVQSGNEDLIVYNNQTVTINPGIYRRIHIYSGANVTINGGEYNLESFNVEPDARLSFNNSSTPIRMWIRNNFYLADRVTINSNAPAENLFIYTNTNSIDLGTDLSLRAILVAPNANVNVSSRYTWNGRIWAREITIQPDAVVR